mgnify:CR=1 FL=1
MVDLTPAAIGGRCIPPVNLKQHAEAQAMNVNMISCAGQATIPVVHGVSRIQPVKYAEIIATTASKSIGPGTRANLDEFTYTTSGAIEKVGGASKGKALIVVNPAEPPMIMRNTIYCITEETPDEQRIRDSVLNMISEVQKYVPGYRLVNGPVFEGNKVGVWMEVEGLGDYLPKYAGNLDIMTAAGLRTAELFAEEVISVARDAGFGADTIVVGHSFGGFITLKTGLLHNDSLEGIVLVDLPTNPTVENSRLLRQQV